MLKYAENLYVYLSCSLFYYSICVNRQLSLSIIILRNDTFCLAELAPFILLLDGESATSSQTWLVEVQSSILYTARYLKVDWKYKCATQLGGISRHDDPRENIMRDFDAIFQTSEGLSEGEIEVYGVSWIADTWSWHRTSLPVSDQWRDKRAVWVTSNVQRSNKTRGQ